MNSEQLIDCTVGILTHNSGKNLRRALESVKDFKDIVIADGGSSDDTLAIAAEYGCRIIDQHAKHYPSGNPYHPISDFALERNQLLQAAKYDWFLYIDSDEYISVQLRDEIADITTQQVPKHLAFEIPIKNQSPDTKVNYRSWKQNYQVRFFNRQLSGEFQKVMHERYVFDRETYSVGRLHGPWYVPYSKPDFISYSKAVNYRLRVMLSSNPPVTLGSYLQIGWYQPMKRFFGLTYRTCLMYILFNHKEVPPLWLYRNIAYSQWVTCRVATSLYMNGGKFS